MSKMLALYEIVKTCIPSSITPKFSFANMVKEAGDNKYKPIENTASIYFRPSVDNLRAISGKYVQESYRLLINLFTTRGEAGVINGISLCEEITSNLDNLINKSYYIDGTGVYIAHTEKSQSYGYVGPTEQGIATFSINYIIKFS